MRFRKLAAGAVVFLMGTMCLRYCYLIYVQAIRPSLATWLMFEVTTLISWRSYRATADSDRISNAGNAVDLASVSIILATLIFFGDTREWRFGPVEAGSLIASALTLVFWKITKRAVAANLAIQAIMVIAYIPTFYRLWYSPKNTESFSVWLVFWLAALLALIPAYSGRNRLARVYATRAAVMVSLLLLLMLKVEWGITW